MNHLGKYFFEELKGIYADIVGIYADIVLRGVRTTHCNVSSLAADPGLTMTLSEIGTVTSRCRCGRLDRRPGRRQARARQRKPERAQQRPQRGTLRKARGDDRVR